ncbi:MAG: DUF6046 domain-containing protein [Flavobacteriales bacterium]|nr:DUF6046 domain-containing protein [Flavobacteriales bacterium]
MPLSGGVSALKPNQLPTLEVDERSATSLLGHAIFDVLQFFDQNGNQVYELNDAPIVSVSLPKNIVKTQIQGRPGTIKEFISNDDYHISVQGILAPGTLNDNRMPLDIMEELAQFLDAPTSYRVSSLFLVRFGITNVVVDNVGEIKPVDGFDNLIQYSFTLLSDDAPEIAI